MTHLAPTPVEVMWRPGCPFCSSLRRGLRKAGVATVEHDIWSSTQAAARVRVATGGDETVPTVFIDGQALINPSVRQVVDAIKVVDPDYQPEAPAHTGRGGFLRTRIGFSPGLLWTLVIAATWLALVSWRPTTTWHLAPLLLASAWPWVVGQDVSPGDRTARRRVLLAGGAGLVASVAMSGALAASGRLDGPTWAGSGSATVEAVLLAVSGAVLAAAAGIFRAMSRAS